MFGSAMTEVPGPILWAAIRTPPGRIDAWIALTGWAPRWRGALGPARAALLGAPVASACTAALLMPPDDRAGGLLLVEAPGAVAPLATRGWAAAELSVAALDDLAAAAPAFGFTVLGPPRALGSGSSVRACQLADPGGAVIYAADVRSYTGRATLHRARHAIDRVFIAVLATRDLDATRAWYAERFGLAHVSDHAVPIPVLDRAWSLEPGTLWRISSQQLAGGGLIELDTYPSAAPLRQRDSFGLPGGVIAVALRHGTDAAFDGPEGERIVLCAGDQ